jgi:hypothetical protein
MLRGRAPSWGGSALDNVVVRDVEAPTEAEAAAMALPILNAFHEAGWELRERLWIPADRRPGLGESLWLSPESQLLLEGEGTLRLTFLNADPLAVAPTATPAAREPDVFEDLGGVRYRRLVPRWAIGAVIGVIGLILFFAVASGMPNSPFAAAPTPDGGVCPLGWVPGMARESGGSLVPDGTCERIVFPN